QRGVLHVVDQPVDELGDGLAIGLAPAGEHVGHVLGTDLADLAVRGPALLGEPDDAHPPISRGRAALDEALVLQRLDPAADGGRGWATCAGSLAYATGARSGKKAGLPSRMKPWPASG